MYLVNWPFKEPQAHLHYSASKPCSLEHKKSFWDRWNGFLNNRAIAAYLFMEYFLCVWCIAIFVHYLTQKAHFHFPKVVNVSSFCVNCNVMLEPVSVQPLPLQNIDLSIIVLFNKHENNNMNKATPYAIYLDNTRYIHCLYNFQLLHQSLCFNFLHFRSANWV